MGVPPGAGSIPALCPDVQLNDSNFGCGIRFTSSLE
jgi:hypothetical protein